MREGERYAQTWHGLFPRYLLASTVFVAMLDEIQLAVAEVGGRFISTAQVSGAPPGVPLYSTIGSLIQTAYMPFVLFALFYLASRVRVVLDRDYARVALSILLGALAAAFFFDVIVTLVIEGEAGAFGGIVLSVLEQTGNSLQVAVYVTFVGFAAVLVSYLRRL